MKYELLPNPQVHLNFRGNFVVVGKLSLEMDFIQAKFNRTHFLLPGLTHCILICAGSYFVGKLSLGLDFIPNEFQQNSVLLPSHAKKIQQYLICRLFSNRHAYKRGFLLNFCRSSRSTSDQPETSKWHLLTSFRQVLLNASYLFVAGIFYRFHLSTVLPTEFCFSVVFVLFRF